MEVFGIKLVGPNAENEQKRLALFALKVEARVWSKDHDPRFIITMQIDLDAEFSGPRLASGDGRGGGRGRGCSRRGCAYNNVSVLVLRWTDRDGPLPMVVD